MAVTRASKVEELQGLEEAFKGTESAILLDFKGLKVPEVTELRRQVRGAKGSYKVVKNTLAKRALKGTAFEPLSEHFVPEDAFVIVHLCADVSHLTITQSVPGSSQSVSAKYPSPSASTCAAGRHARDRSRRRPLGCGPVPLGPRARLCAEHGAAQRTLALARALPAGGRSRRAVMSQLAVRVQELGKEYSIGFRTEKYKTLRDSLAALASAPVRLLQRRHR